MPSNGRCAILAAAALVALSAMPASAWEPEQPIRIVVGYSPGGGTDVVARTVASAAQPIFPVPLVIENRAGASGTLAADYVAKAPADGYTLLVAGGSESTSVPHHREVSYDNEGDFRPIIRITRYPIIFATRADSGYDSIDALMEAAKADPGALSFASSGPGSLYHSAMLALNAAGGADMKHVPYQGGAPAVAALLGGHVDVTPASPNEIQAQHEAGTVNLLAVASEERYAGLPDVPTLKELGYDVTIENMKGFVAPAGLPDEVYAYLHDAFRRTMETETFQTLAEQTNLEPAYQSGPEFEETMAAMSETIRLAVEPGSAGQ
jgi:tripartite-type tricarboxylate transporter receptor subunit TctC